MRSYISSTVEEYRNLTEQWQEVVSQNKPAILNTEPARDSWSAAECLQHVIITGNKYVDHLAMVIDKTEKEGPHGDANYQPGILGRFILSQTNPPYKMRIKTFPVIDPVLKDYNIEELMNEYKSMKQDLQDLIGSLDGINISRKFTRSAITSLLWMPIGLWFRFIAAHERRHLWQAQRAIERANKNVAMLEQ